MAKRKTFSPGERVEVQRTPSSRIWTEMNYLGLFTVNYGQRPWHLVQVNADRHIVPSTRIRPARKGTK